MGGIFCLLRHYKLKSAFLDFVCEKITVRQGWKNETLLAYLNLFINSSSGDSPESTVDVSPLSVFISIDGVI